MTTGYDLDLRVLRGCYEGLKSPKKVETDTRNRHSECYLEKVGPSWRKLKKNRNHKKFKESLEILKKSQEIHKNP